MDDNYIPKHASFNDLNKLKEMKESDDELEKEEQIDEEFSEETLETTEIYDEIAEENEEIIKEVNITEDKLDEENNLLEYKLNTKEIALINNLKSIDTNEIEKTKPVDINEIRKNNIPSNKKKRKKKNRTKKILCILLLIFFLSTLTISASQLLKWGKDNKETSKVIDNIQDEVNVVELEDNETTELISQEEDKNSDYWYYVNFPLIDVDINKLKEKNQYTAGWINVNNTNINYPYVLYKDNDFYLDHSYDDTYNEAGWVFMDYRNSSDLNNKNTILYAHSRLDKTMFGSLSKTLKYDWYTNKDNHIIRISTETENTLWQIFSIYKIEEENYYITTNFASDDEYQQFLNTIKERSIYNFNPTLTPTDKILTLSTCYSDNVRTVVHARLIKKSIK